MREHTYIFDIETGPLPMAELHRMLEPFNAQDVKLGNVKDPAKIAEKIASAEITHQERQIERAALNPTMGRVLAIGYCDADGGGEIDCLENPDEAVLLNAFWSLVNGEMGRINPMIGFNTHAFDWPFLVRRSWKHGIRPPCMIRKGRYWCEQFTDLLEVWQMGNRMEFISLDRVAKYLGVGQKNGDGALFYKLWAEDREKALDYLRNDIELTLGVARKLLGTYPL